MAPDSRSGFDFSAQAKALLKRISPASGGMPKGALALAAIEVALREAFEAGKTSFRAAPASKAKPAPAPSPKECDHQWEEVFLDGRDLGNRCKHCNVLQRDVEEHCTHFFVDVGGNQVCMACRKTANKSRIR